MDNKLGVIIGRFQTPELHQGHKGLIDQVLNKHHKVLILLGSIPGVLVTRQNPLDYHTRSLMIREAYPSVMILPIHDMMSDKDWSQAVDDRISEVLDIGDAILYGSRDAFIPHYSGRFKTIELESAHNISASEIRKGVSDDVRTSTDFRRGIIYAAHNRHLVTYPTVDIAIVKWFHKKPGALVLARKKSDPANMWRFPGGFVDPTKDGSLEYAAAREAGEEIGCAISHPKYVGSTIIDDWRYRKDVDKIMTSFFMCEYLYGTIDGKDDINEARLFDFDKLSKDMVLPAHRPLLGMLLDHLDLTQYLPCPKCGSNDHRNLGDGTCVFE
jgi:bifunctional NMN adenylyltransferase/nudix hydrolase